MEWDKERFRKMFPSLYKEIKDGVMEVKLKDLYRDPWRNYLPSPEDFIARARNQKEAEEIIDYLERIGEISREKASELREKLMKGGIEAFGERRTPGYYFRKAREALREEIEKGEE
jgi:hypothetical protein